MVTSTSADAGAQANDHLKISTPAASFQARRRAAARRSQPSLTSYRTEKLKERPVDEMAFRKVYFMMLILGGGKKSFLGGM
jgi:hypothetical protein